MRAPTDPETFIGKVLTRLDSDSFAFSDGSQYCLYHSQDCCETVGFVRLRGSVDSVLHKPLVGCSVNHDEPPEESKRKYYESYTWTNFRFDTNNGWVEVCWLGESNGYYGEDVEIIQDS